ncbi:hypothetical protein Ahy_A02g006985 [Arachis hypogaea]|uniref:Aminotransferase-like plant mobile domain-containing protein n=1 Tax=Arachis hypogaea TaxID=3818 RepID=A0A445EBA5_ARAHY|nr:hypothetical protein Ahy_A02g006985 [Arachis hypogaea]
MILVCFVYSKSEDLRCSTRLLHEKFKYISEMKKVIIRELGFEGLMHIPLINVPHKLLKELALSFNLSKSKLDMQHCALRIKPKKNRSYPWSECIRKLVLKGYPRRTEIFRRFQEKTLKNMSDEMMSIGIDNDQDHQMFKRIFILYIQMAFLLPTTINKVFPVHMPPIFQLHNITEWSWGSHVLNFIIKDISNYHLKKKKFIAGCLYVLMIVYFHETKHKDKRAYAILGPPWVMHWDREALVQRIRAKIDGHIVTDRNTFSNLGVFDLYTWCKLTF